MTSLETVDVDLTDLSLYRDGIPHDLFTELRDAGAVLRHRPVSLLPDGPETPFWSIFRHAEITAANRDWETFTATDSVGISPTRDGKQGHMLVSMDPPDHTRLRRLVSAGFTPRMIAALEGHIARRTATILDAVPVGEEIDFVSQIAFPLPMHVIADIVGIPEADRPWVFERTDTMLRALDPSSGLPFETQFNAQVELFQYAQQLTEAKRAEPADDVWTLIAQAEITDDDGRVHAVEGIELEMFFVILSIAGSETTRNAISQGLMALVEHPEQLAALRADPSLLPAATEEIIRWSSPVLFFGRTATRDVELGGVSIRAGERVVLWYPSGNRDERAFADPFAFDITRSPNPHVSFGGGGPHYCLGANLAKKEVQVMIGALVERFAGIEAGAATWSGSGPRHNVGVSVDRLPVRLTA